MDRDHGLRSRTDAVGKLLRIHAVVNGIDVDEYRARTQPRHDPSGGEKREGRHHHLVTGADAERHQRFEQGVGARGDTHRMRNTEGVGGLALEILHLGAEDETLRFAHPVDGPSEFLAKRFVLTGQIKQRNGHR